MIIEEDLKEVGKFQKTHALKGELNALLDIDPEFFDDGNPLVLDIDGIYVPFYVNSIRTKGTFSFLMTIQGVSSEEEAKKFVNKSIYALKEDLLDYYDDEDLNFAEDFEGYKVIDVRRGDLGIIDEIDDTTENVLMIVRTTSGENIYLPFNEAFINSVDDEGMIVTVNLPDGMPGIDD